MNSPALFAFSLALLTHLTPAPAAAQDVEPGKPAKRPPAKPAPAKTTPAKPAPAKPATSKPAPAKKVPVKPETPKKPEPSKNTPAKPAAEGTPAKPVAPEPAPAPKAEPVAEETTPATEPAALDAPKAEPVPAETPETKLVETSGAPADPAKPEPLDAEEPQKPAPAVKAVKAKSEPAGTEVPDEEIDAEKDPAPASAEEANEEEDTDTHKALPAKPEPKLEIPAEWLTKVTAVKARQFLNGATADKDLKIVPLDIRTDFEFSMGHLPGAMHVDFLSGDFITKVAALDKDTTYVLHCQTGVRSSKSLATFKAQGFKSILHMNGGYAEWKKEDFPIESTK